MSKENAPATTEAADAVESLEASAVMADAVEALEGRK